MSFSALVSLGNVGAGITSVKLYYCGGECTSCVEMIEYSNVSVSLFPLTVQGIPNESTYIQIEGLGACGVTQCLPISNIVTPTQTPTPTPTPTPTLPALSLSVSSTTLQTCWNTNDASFTVSATGGNGAPYEYSRDNSNWQSSATFSGLAGTTYTAYVRNDWEELYEGPVATTSITSLARSTPNATFTSNNISCYGGSDGTITTAIIDANGVYYRYNAGEGFTNTSGTRYNVGTSVGSLTSGSYTFRIYNSNETCYQDYPITLTQPTQQTASITSIIGVSNGLNNGSLTISSGGGTWNKTYRLYKDSLTPYNDYPTDNLISTYSNVTSGSPTFNVEGLACGYYWLQVTDANGCVTNTIEYEIPCPAPEVTLYAVELRSGSVGGNSDFGSACYNLYNGALMDVTIYTETGAFTDEYQAFTDSSGDALYTGVGYYTDGSVYGRIQGGTISHDGSCND